MRLTLRLASVLLSLFLLTSERGVYANQPTQPLPKEKSMESAKRRVPKVAPVVIGSVRYEVLKGARGRGFHQNGGIVAAMDATSGKELWTLQIYTTAYDTHEEQDVQDRFITKMQASPDGKSLLIESENKNSYAVLLADRSITIKP